MSPRDPIFNSNKTNFVHGLDYVSGLVIEFETDQKWSTHRMIKMLDYIDDDFLSVKQGKLQKHVGPHRVLALHSATSGSILGVLNNS